MWLKLLIKTIFTKKTPNKPFRRSPLWLTARVILQLLLANTLEVATAMLLYKVVLLRFLCTFLEESFVKQLDTDTAMQMIAKVVRRLYKVDTLFQHNSSAPECLSLLTRQSQIAVAEAVENARAVLNERWAAIIEKEREESQTHTAASTPTIYRRYKAQC